MRRRRKDNFFRRLAANRVFMRLVVPATVIIVGFVLIVTAPWQTAVPVIDEEPTPDPVIIVTPEPPPPTPEEYEEEEEEEEEPAPAPDPVPEPDDGIYNPLTGLPVDEDISMNRPWAVALGNTAEALPLHGIGRADILCEYLVEGTTRFMAIYQDVAGIERIGGLRSLRTSSMQVASGFDAIFTHWIGRTYDNIETFGNPVTRFDTIDASSGGVGYRFSGKRAPHNGYTDGDRLIKSLPSSFRAEHAPGFEQTLKFTEDGTPANGKDAKIVVVNFLKNYKSTRFSLDPDGKYYVRHHGRDLVDGLDGKQLGFTNVLVMRTAVETGYNSMGHTYIGTTGEGTGFFICGGKYTEITWKRPTLDDLYSFYLEDGSPLIMGAGKTFICITARDEVPTFE